jgi:DNA mismatch repair protein MutS
MLEQYRRIRRDHQGEVLFFRLGDFYEMFCEDALEISALLNLTLTSRNGNPMCGIPYHAARSYIARLLKLGKKIAICEQISAPGKGLMEREVTEVITPGTTVEDDYLEKGSANYLACLAFDGHFFSFAYMDLSAGDFHATSFGPEGAGERIRGELERLQIRELLIQESILDGNSGGIALAVFERGQVVLNRWADWLFDFSRSRKRLEKQFGASLKGFGLSDNSPEILAAGAILDYLDDTARSLLPHVRVISLYTDSQYVGIDESTQRNLELVKNLRDGDVRFSLLEVLDETRTAMGRRLLKRRILHPLRNAEQIGARLDMVEVLYRDQGKLGALREILGKTPDLERLSARLAMDKAHGKDMAAVKNTLVCFEQLEELGKNLSLSFESREAAFSDPESFKRLREIRCELEKGICEDPSILLTEGNLIRDGYSPELDQFKSLRDNGRQMLEAYLEEEKAATGIPGLKIRYNRLIGYYFEVTKLHLGKVPARFIRRQGIAAGERFSTEKLASLESRINGASDLIVELERKIFLELREKAKHRLSELSAAARRIAELDAAQSLARSATVRGWVRPLVDNGDRLEIYEGRHPVVEAHLPRGEFIPNDIILDRNAVSFALITGPNMAGKSTYLRSAALITLMAQMGSFVPAREANIGMADRIYCRVGASDNLARGESTFLTEMNETAYILNTATDRSLVIMDEVGRGTGTNDGLAIAWAVCEDILGRVQCRTLFATHYHELSLLSHPRLANRSMEVRGNGEEIVFLRKLREGPAAESYGLYVARLAGLSGRLLERAGIILERIRERTAGITAIAAEPATAEPVAPETGTAAQNEQIRREHLFLKELASLDPDTITPMEALKLIAGWKERFAARAGADSTETRVSRSRGKRNFPVQEKKPPGLFD